ncbi:hypothetical protein IGI04_007801 [Brassica rapa subsp. trilocularis]|uniref:Uncharacterized protein n=1 Tax=Brassica rapa subsp. trilocularis TaxID=1813537 RepID=A0ABQ7NKS6_BRACM|nr:hypothetical protein IGI04_007801 [Brassica rapa subsp. trilocularis]
MIPYSVSLSRQSRLPLSHNKKATQRRFVSSLRQDNGDQRQSSLLHLSLMTRRRHKVNDYVNRLKEILGTVPPACCMELPYFHGKAAELGDIIGSGRISNRLLSMYLACMGFGILALLRGLVSHSTKRSPVLARRKRA